MDQYGLDLDSARRDIAQLSDEGAERLATELRDMAFHMSSRIHYTEGRLSTIAGLGGALVAFGTAILSLISALGENVSRAFWLAVLIFSISSIVAGLVVWFVYAKQTNFPYAFKGVAGPRTWFYRDAIPGSGSFEVPPSAYFDDAARKAKESSQEIRDAFQERWPDYATHTTSVLSDPRENSLENLQQVYLLHYNEFYKNRFLSQLRSVLRFQIQWVLVPELVFLLVMAILELIG